MGRYIETNVRIPVSAWDALESVKQARGVSRDETVRQLIAEHLDRQERLDEDHRLTHISTLLRHPPAPRHRGDPKGGRVLRLRLRPGVVDRARAVSLRLPGQPERRGHRDYQARLLTDAVVTSIATAALITDEVLDGLMPCVRQRAALGLWRLAVAATTTTSEQRVFEEADRLQREIDGGDRSRSAYTDRVILVAETLRDEDIAWHERWRQEAVRHLVRELLSGSEAIENEAMLYEQTLSVWGLLRHDLENRTGHDHPLLQGLRGHHQDLEGRGGTAVWRVERRLELEEFGSWLVRDSVNHTQLRSPATAVVDERRERVLSPPGWRIEIPKGWRAVELPRRATHLQEPWASHVASKRVLYLEARNRPYVWPVILAPGKDAPEPVPGMEVALAVVVRTQSAIEIAERLLIVLDSDCDDENEYLSPVNVPAHTAHKLGLIDATALDRLVAEAQAATKARMRSVIMQVPAHQPGVRQALRDRMDTPAQFGLLASQHDLEFAVIRPMWTWKVHSVAAKIDGRADPGSLRWLATWASKRAALGLEQSMQAAWHDAFARSRPLGDGYVTSTV